MNQFDTVTGRVTPKSGDVCAVNDSFLDLSY